MPNEWKSGFQPDSAEIAGRNHRSVRNGLEFSESGWKPDLQIRVPSQSPSLSRSRARRWIAHLWREWTVESWRPIAPAFAHPQPNEWSNDQLTAAWLGHSTVLINFFGITILTDPVLFPRIGIRIPPLFTIGPKRLTKPALKFNELPPIDLVLLSHAHFDHIDTRTLHKFSKRTAVVTAPRTSDLLRWMRFRDITELRWGESHELHTDRGSLRIKAFRVNHWGARLGTTTTAATTATSSSETIAASSSAATPR